MVRKTVTLVFCDVADSTQLGERLDPEALRGVWSRYHETARSVLERHGGTIEKFIGDAVMAAFGIPVVHEDDALRAVRAAAELRSELTRLNDELERDYGVRIGVRTGVNTGQVIAGDPAHGQAFATGDAVNVAQRLEARAEAGEILLGDATLRLVRDAVTVEPLPQLELKGKSVPVRAWRLLAVERSLPGLVRRLDAPLVGRRAELDRLHAELEHAVADRSCHVLTIVGEPGVGKSRLAAELIASLGEEVLALEGRCLPYGRGITYWPLVEMVRRLAAEAEPAAALARLLAGEPEGDLICARVLEAVGLAPPKSRSDELYWAVRRLLETLGRRRPVVVMVDDLQWAEPAFLNLVEYLAGWSRDAPILICCLARTDLAELRPSWASTPTLRLEPLGRHESRLLLEQLIGPLAADVADAVGRATGGNPLFLEEMLRMLVEDGLLAQSDGRFAATVEIDALRVPETVQAVLAARLDRLEPEERAVLERAAVVGEVFWSGAVAELMPPDEAADVSARLHALLRKGLVRPDRSTFAGEDAFRFAHLLVRDAAYEAMAKQLRAELHGRLADWIERRAGAGKRDEIVGHHLEQAYRYRTELAAPTEAEDALAGRAAALLARAGRRALARDDAHAARNLLGRAAALRGGDAALLVELGEALFALGRFAEAERANAEAVEAAEAVGDTRSAVAARLSSALIGLLVRNEGGVNEIAERVDQALPTFERLGDDATVARLLTRLADAYWWRCQVGPMEEALERALAHARRARDEREAAVIAMRLGLAAVTGPLPVADGRRRLDELLAELAPDSSARGLVLVASGLLASMAGELDEGRRRAREGVAIPDSLGRSAGLAAIRTWSAAVELNAGDAATAEQELRSALAHLQELGERANLSSVAAELAEALYAQGRHAEAVEATRTSEEAASADDLHAQIAWRVARSKALAALGDGAAAQETARDALALARETDAPLLTGDALLALACALLAAGRTEDGQVRAREALVLYEAKGNTVAAAQARRLTQTTAAEHTASPTA